MRWANAEWAARHIAKHKVTPEEAWEAFLSIKKAIRARDEPRFPPHVRYWGIGTTVAGRKLLVVWDRHREVFDLITAFEPDPNKEAFYARETKQQKKGR